MTEIEIWRPVPGWEGFYEVSDHGRVRSVDRVVIVQNWRGPYSVAYRGVVLRLKQKSSGHLEVSLKRPGEVRSATIHTLVMKAFVGPRPPGLVVCHNNGLAWQNHLGNLRYDTYVSNEADKKKHGGLNPEQGERRDNHKLTDDDVRWIRENYGCVGTREMGRMFGISHGIVSQVASGKRWKHVLGGVFC